MNKLDQVDIELLEQQLSRSNALLGEDGLKNIFHCKIALVGLAGGVASQVCMHLVRTGCTNITLIDSVEELSRLCDVEMLSYDSILQHDDVLERRSRVDALRHRAVAILPHIQLKESNDLEKWNSGLSCEAQRVVVFCNCVESGEAVVVKQLKTMIENDKLRRMELQKAAAAAGGGGGGGGGKSEKFVALKALMVADWRFLNDATRLRVSPVKDSSIDDSSARLLRRLLFRVNIRTNVGIVHANASPIGFGAQNVKQRVEAMTTDDQQAGIAYSPSYAISLGAILASHVMGCVTGSFEQSWHSSTTRKQANKHIGRTLNKLVRRYKGEVVPPATAVGYMVDSMWDNRSALSRIPNVEFVLMKWNKELPLECTNLILLTIEESKEFLNVGQELFSKSQKEFVNNVFEFEKKIMKELELKE